MTLSMIHDAEEGEGAAAGQMDLLISESGYLGRGALADGGWGGGGGCWGRRVALARVWGRVEGGEGG